MTIKTTLITSAVLAVLATATASAGPSRGDRPEPPRTRAEAMERALERFERADKNEDGFISPDEIGGEGRRAALAGRMFKARDDNDDGFISPDEVQAHAGEIFDAMDTNSDGELSDAELEEARKNRRQRRKQRRG